MKKFTVISKAGIELGSFQAETPEQALDMMAQEAGYSNQEEAEKETGRFRGTVEEHGWGCVPEGSKDFYAAGDEALNRFESEAECIQACESLDETCPLEDGKEWMQEEHTWVVARF